MPLKKLMTKWRNYPYVAARFYRIPMPVKEIMQYKNGDCYPVCPRCAVTMEREYVHFCDRCGQMLAWDFFEHAHVIAFPREENGGCNTPETCIEQKEQIPL